MDLGTIIGVIVGLVVLVVGVIIINDVIFAQTFGGTLKTVTDNIPILLGIGGLVLAVGWAVLR